MDERIRETKNRIAARGFGIWYVLLLAVLLYRQFYLGQDPREYWDFALIFFTGTLYVAVASHAKGAIHERSLSRFWRWTVPVITLTIIALNYFQGKLVSIAGFLETLISALIGVSCVGLVFYFLYRRWEKKIGLEE